ncbi:hypothetical protein Bbelb_290390 [Branchiostoma belcheri]|nr:hypothetical protein Bbelb_290390 [Branchiostoma belcheri]
MILGGAKSLENSSRGGRNHGSEIPVTPGPSSVNWLTNSLGVAVSKIRKDQKELAREVERNRESQGEIIDLLKELKDRPAAPAPPLPSTPKKVPNELALEVKRIHKALGEEHQFRGNELFTSDHNQSTYQVIRREVLDGPVEYRQSHIKKAIRNCHENLRRADKNRRLGLAEKKKTDSKKLKRKHRLKDDRIEVGRTFLSPRDRQFLEGISKAPLLMSDEDTDPEDPDHTWLVKQPAWRSERLNGILKLCQAKLDKTKASRQCHRRKMTTTPSPRPRPPSVASCYLLPEDEEGGDQEAGSEPVETAENGTHMHGQLASQFRILDPKVSVTNTDGSVLRYGRDVVSSAFWIRKYPSQIPTDPS